MAGFELGSVTGVGTLEVAAGVAVAEERGLLLDLGREGACKKSSGISFQLSMACGTGVVAESTRGGAEVDFGGGGGRLMVGGAVGGAFGVCSLGLVATDFFSQLDIEDCIFFVREFAVGDVRCFYFVIQGLGKFIGVLEFWSSSRVQCQNNSPLRTLLKLYGGGSVLAFRRKATSR